MGSVERFKRLWRTNEEEELEGEEDEGRSLPGDRDYLVSY